MDYAHQRVHQQYPSGSDHPQYSSAMSSSQQLPQPPAYVMLSDQNGSIRPPPYRRNIPRYHSTSHKSSGCSCLRCICCCFCVLFVLIFIFAALAFYFYAVYQPQVPSYKVEDFGVRAFSFGDAFSLHTEFMVTVKAENPNAHIGLIYGQNSSVDVEYSNSTLCSGKLPAFYQGHKNTTVLQVPLKGTSEFGSGLQQAMMDNRHNGKIPLLVKVKVPVRVVVGSLPLRQLFVFVNCSLVVNSISPNQKIRILSSKYNVEAALNG
ncbi:NDR1/HIN1-like protein 6 [Malania oleifera]|uniref:NDR1/HIN1-like protein 6 n=1 Tax=Malania oleifera TaxID=397392 RepID=UPI0025AEA086|nr:NDR1/HIN1-like protein 6 [Malania oleifera]